MGAGSLLAERLGKGGGSCAHHCPGKALLWSQAEGRTEVLLASKLRPLLDGLPEPPEAENKGKGGCGACQVRERVWGTPMPLADSVSLDEQKAKGDVKKKGRLDPYAYIPLNRTRLNRRYGAVQERGWGLCSGGLLIKLPTRLLTSLQGFFILICSFV